MSIQKPWFVKPGDDDAGRNRNEILRTWDQEGIFTLSAWGNSRSLEWYETRSESIEEDLHAVADLGLGGTANDPSDGKIGQHAGMLKSFYSDMEVGDFVFGVGIRDGFIEKYSERTDTSQDWMAVGIVTGEYEYAGERKHETPTLAYDEHHLHHREVQWFRSRSGELLLVSQEAIPHKQPPQGSLRKMSSKKRQELNESRFWNAVTEARKSQSTR